MGGTIQKIIYNILGDIYNISYQFVSGSCDTQAKVWDKRQPLSPTLEFWGHEADINCVEYCKDGFTFVTGSDDASVRMWDIRSNRELAKFSDEGVIHGITSVAISKSGRIIFAGQDDYNCMMWNTLDQNKEPIRLMVHLETTHYFYKTLDQMETNFISKTLGEAVEIQDYLGSPILTFSKVKIF